jgi:hypothetical protein
MKALSILSAVLAFCLFYGAAWGQAPAWQWGTALPGWNGELTATATDAAGNTYVTGFFQDTLVLGPHILSYPRRCLAVAKLDPDGNWLWARQNTYAGTSVSLSRCTSVAVDASGNVYVGGSFHGPMILGSLNFSCQGWYDLFAAKLDPDGNWLWASIPAQNDDDWSYVYSLALDAQANLYVSGCYSDVLALGSSTLTSEDGCEELYAAKLDTNGNWLWARSHDGSGTQDYSQAWGIAVDGSQNVYVAGYFDDQITLGATTLACDGYYDMFIAKLDPAGTWAWARLADLTEESETIYPLDMSADPAGNVYLCGPYDYDVSFGGFSLSGEWGGNFIVKLDPAGTYQWAHQLGEGEYHGWGIDLALDGLGNPCVTSYFTGSITLGDWSHTTLPDWYDILVAKLDPAGNWLWAQTANDASDEGGTHISLDAQGNLYVVGTFWGTLALGDSLLTGYDYDYFIGKLGEIAGPALPKPPQNLIVSVVGNGLHLQWDPVTQDTSNQPFTPEYYRVYYTHGDPEEGFNLLAQTTGTFYTHTGGATFPRALYRVTAFSAE